MKNNHQNIPDREQFSLALKKCGLKATAQRLAVHDAMMVLGHASADMVLEYVRKYSDVKVTTASVYNTLSQMADLGLYTALSSANNKMYFDVCTAGHFHMYDCENHVYRDIVDDELYAEFMQMLGRRKFKGYNLTGVDIHFVVRPSKRRLVR